MNVARTRATGPDDWMLEGGGEMASLIGHLDWASTPLGARSRWSRSLKAAVAMILHSRHPMFLWWGPELVQIYNDAYVPSFGLGKHPTALGQRGRECWPEIWSIIGPQIDDVMHSGVASWHEDALVPIFRNGAIEEVYWTYGYSPVFDDDGAIGGTLVVCTETTGRVRAAREEAALRAEIERDRARLQQFFAQAPAGICILRGPELTFEFANDHYRALVGRRDIIGKPLLTALPELEGQGLDTLLHDVMASGEAYVGRERPLRMDRRGLGVLDDAYYTFIYSPVRDASGRVEAVIALALDVSDEVFAKRQAEELRAALLASEQRARQAAELASRAKDDFLSTASHELRTPLNAILGWARMIQSGALPNSDFLRGVDSIERNARSQVRLIDDILDGSRIITGKLHLEVRPLDLTALVQAAVDALRPSADTKRITVTVTVDAAAKWVSGDAVRLQQVVWNLVNNAIKFTPKGGTIDVTLSRVGTDVQFIVADTGEGIAADFLPHVFERFRQAEGSTTRRHGGLGLGLALVRHLVEAHGGTVHAHSDGQGRGSIFTVTLPVHDVSTQEGAVVAPLIPTSDRPFVPRAVDLTGATILVVDDEVDARDLIATALRSKGAEVLTAESAANALSLITTRAFTAIVSDIGMPNSDGYELIGRIRTASGARGHELPAVALTAYSREEDRRRALAAGFQAYLAKPVEPDDLIEIVARLTADSLKAAAHAPVLVSARADVLRKFTRILDVQGVHEALRFLNSRSSHRFTGIYRFDAPTLRNVALLDADAPMLTKGDDAPLEATYSSIVGAFERPFTTEDAERDGRLHEHPARESVRSYCGVLLRTADGGPYGTLCHFDVVPRDVPVEELALMEDAAPLLMAAL
jgi:signal transduction histidine kinase/FixJ family two-component response regulator